MSGTYPTNVGFKALNFKSRKKVLKNRAESSKRWTRDMGGQYYAFTISHPPMTRANFQPFDAFIEDQDGSSETFTVIPPDRATPLGVATGTPLVNGVHAVGVTSISTDGWTNSTTDIVKAGDRISFAGHTKVYLITADANSGATTGPATITIKPPLREALADNEVVNINNVAFTVALAGDVQEYKTLVDGLYRYEIDVEEDA